MAGARNTEGAALDTAIDAVVSAYATYEAVSVAGEDSAATKRYFFKSLFNKLGANSDLANYIYKQQGFQKFGFTPTGSADIVTIDPNSAA
jgi:hypothetical protein